jgi:hypothetical protein
MQALPGDMRPTSQRLQNFQNKLLRIIAKLLRVISTETVHEQTGAETITS